MLAARFAASRLAVGTTPGSMGLRGQVGGGKRVGWRYIRDGRTPGVGIAKTIGFVRAQSGLASSTTSTTQQSSSDNTSSSSATPPPPPKRSTRILSTLALTLFTFTAGFIMASAPALQNVKSLANPPSDAETLTLYTPPTPELLAIEQQIFTHPLTQSLLADPDTYIASRPHLKIPASLRPQNLTGGTLLGEDKIAVPPLQFTTHDGSRFTSLQYLGPALCGHPGIVHGGLLATLLDEGLARCCFPALPNKVAVTASLKIEYKRPVMAGQVVVLRAETTKVEGRKAWVKGWLETLPTKEGEEPVVLTEGEALFIEPRQAAGLMRVAAA